MRIIVSVVARARTESVEEIGEGMYKVRVCAVPERGKANDAVRRILARHFGVRRAQVHIIAGATTRKKMVDISTVNA